jgi:hypothetical protein
LFPGFSLIRFVGILSECAVSHFGGEDSIGVLGLDRQCVRVGYGVTDLDPVLLEEYGGKTVVDVSVTAVHSPSVRLSESVINRRYNSAPTHSFS